MRGSAQNVVVAVVAIGEEELYRLTLPLVQRWCYLHGHILEVIGEASPYTSPFWAKFKAYDFYEKHNADCVIMMDADILIKPGSPTPADRRSRHGVHAFDSMSLPYMRQFVSKQQERYRNLLLEATGQTIPITEHYLNGGVCVVWKDSADFLAPPPYESPVSTGLEGAFDDQNLMNARSAGRFIPLPRAFNWGHPHKEENFRRMKDGDVYFLHLNCPGNKLEIAKEILEWPCFRNEKKHWWVRNQTSAEIVNALITANAKIKVKSLELVKQAKKRLISFKKKLIAR